MKGMNYYPLHTEKVSWIQPGDTIVVVNLSSGYCYTLNCVAGSIWKLCDGKKSFNDIAKSITKQYNIDEKTAFEDLKDFIKTFVKAGLLSLSRQKAR
jgi:hypothetical protein